MLVMPSDQTKANKILIDSVNVFIYNLETTYSLWLFGALWSVRSHFFYCQYFQVHSEL